MKSKARIGNHPIHPMLICLPLGLWIFSYISDFLYFCKAGPYWEVVSAYAIAGGIVGAVAAAIPGFIDYFTIKDTALKRIATWHMVLNLGAVVLYSCNLFLRWDNNVQPNGLPFLLSSVTVILLAVSGWLGGELIYVHRVSVLEKGETPSCLL